MMLYRIVNGAVSFSSKTILEEINFEVKNHEHVAIVGRNGCGKTTMLKVINGDISIDSGLGESNLVVIKQGIDKIGYIKQDAIMDEHLTMLDEILKAYEEITDVYKRLEKMELSLTKKYDEKLLNKYQDLYLYYQNIGGYTYKKEYESGIKAFGFSDNDIYKKIGEFSYGQRTKIAFLRLLLSKPDLLLLDEPTNHLDVVAIEWLEEYLKNYPKMLVVVSHDRMFLDKVCNITYEIEYGSLTRYTGNYSYYEKEKRVNYLSYLKDYERQKKEIVRLQSIADRFKYKPSKASMAMSRLSMIERMPKLDKPKSADERTFISNFNPRIESYLEVLKVSDLKIGYDDFVLGNINFSLERGDCLGIIGENGCGKSTFLKTIMGEIPKLGGKCVFGNRVEIGYFDQNVQSLDETATVLEIMEREFPNEKIVNLRKILGGFEFYGDMVFQKVSSLSGGQKVKLLLCKIMRHQPNVLILDEPTNHLDILSKETIEKLFINYKGTIIFVSHDRYLIKKLANKVLVFEQGEINFYNGNYDYYLSKKRNKMIDKVFDNVKVVDDRLSSKKKYTNDFKEKSKLKQKIKKIELEIDRLEKEKELYNQDLLKEEVYLNQEKAFLVKRELDRVDEILLRKLAEWEKLMEELE